MIRFFAAVTLLSLMAAVYFFVQAVSMPVDNYAQHAAQMQVWSLFAVAAIVCMVAGYVFVDLVLEARRSRHITVRRPFRRELAMEPDEGFKMDIQMLRHSGFVPATLTTRDGLHLQGFKLGDDDQSLDFSHKLDAPPEFEPFQGRSASTMEVPHNLTRFHD